MIQEAMAMLESEGAAVTEQMKAEPMVLGSGDLAFYLNDTMYTEEDVHIVNPPMMKFDLGGDDDPEESDLPLYRKENDLGKMDFNWDKSLGNIEDVDKLFRMDSSFEQACKPPGNGLQWHGVEIISSSGLPETNCDAAANDKVEGLDMKFEFVSTNPLICPPLDIPQVPKFEEQCRGGTDVTNKLLPAPAQLPFHPQLPESSGSGQSVKGIYNNAMTPAIWKAQNESEVPSVIFSSSERASIAQAHRARRHAANRKRHGGRLRGHLNSQRGGKEVPYAHQERQKPQPTIPVQTDLHLPSSANLHGYSTTVLPLPSTMQAADQPLVPYKLTGYPQPYHLIPSLAPTPSFPGQVQQQSQEMYSGYEQPLLTLRPKLLQNQHQLRTSSETSISVPSSDPIMTSHDMSEKLRWQQQQQMQARLAVEHLAGVATFDVPVLSKILAQPQELMPASEPEAAAIAESVNTSSSTNPDTPLSVGQSSAEASFNEEDENLQAAVLHQLEGTMMKLDLGTRLSIRDALYRLAQSATQRRLTCADSGNNSQTSGDADASSSALESSIGRDPSSPSQHRVSRPIQPSSDALWMYHSGGLPTNWSGEALANLVEGMDPVIEEGVETGFAMFPETSMCMSQVTYNPQLTIRAPTATQSCTDDLAAPFDQQNNMLSYVSKDSNHQSQTLQQSNIASSMLAGETSRASGIKRGEKVTDSSQAPTTQGRSSTSGQQDCYGIQKEVQPSRLQRAAGIKELTKYVDEMAPIGSSKVEDETLSLTSPSLILSSASDNWQATNLFKNSGIPVP